LSLFWAKKIVGPIFVHNVGPNLDLWPNHFFFPQQSVLVIQPYRLSFSQDQG
jgi:hypothetical protein